jgi:hypothetical protein
VPVVVGGEQLQVASRRQVRVEPRALDEPGHPGQRARPGLARPPEQPDRAGIGPHQPEQHPQQRRLARAVGPEQAVHPAPYPQIDTGHRYRRAVTLHQPVDLDRQHRRRPVRLDAVRLDAVRLDAVRLDADRPRTVRRGSGLGRRCSPHGRRLTGAFPAGKASRAGAAGLERTFTR